MINGIGNSASGRIGGTRAAVEPGQATARTAQDQQRPSTGAAASTPSEIAAMGPPIDAARIAEVKAAIADGRYPVDPKKIAEGMIAFWFGKR